MRVATVHGVNGDIEVGTADGGMVYATAAAWKDTPATLRPDTDSELRHTVILDVVSTMALSDVLRAAIKGAERD